MQRWTVVVPGGNVGAVDLRLPWSATRRRLHLYVRRLELSQLQRQADADLPPRLRRARLFRRRDAGDVQWRAVVVPGGNVGAVGVRVPRPAARPRLHLHVQRLELSELRGQGDADLPRRPGRR